MVESRIKIIPLLRITQQHNKAQQVPVFAKHDFICEVHLHVYLFTPKAVNN